MPQSERTSEFDYNAIFRQLESDVGNIDIIAKDYQTRYDLVYAIDCHDLVKYIHSSRQDSDILRRAIHRYVDHEREILLLPTWAYEFLEYMRNVILGNTERFGGENGVDRLFEKYRQAKEFHDCFGTGEHTKAINLFHSEKPWVQIVNLARFEGVQKLLGAPITEFLKLVDTGKLVALGGTYPKPGFDVKLNDRTVRKLNSLRANRPLNNEVDALSISIISDLNEKMIGQKKYISAVTGTRVPLRSFRMVLGKDSQQMARSPNACIAKILFDSLPESERKKIMNSVKQAASWLLENECDMSDYETLSQVSETSDIREWSGARIEQFLKKKEIADKIDAYIELYYEGLMQYEVAAEVDTEKEAEEVYRVLESKKRLRNGFQQMKELVKEPTRSLIRGTEKYIEPGADFKVKKRSLKERMDKIKDLFDY